MPKRKQPFRNTILKMEKERKALKDKMFAVEEKEAEAEEIFAEAEAVAEEISHQEDEMMKREAELSAREGKVQQFEKHLHEEMKHINKYHPMVNNVMEMGGSVTSVNAPQLAFEKRFYGPMIDWDDHNDRGMVKLQFSDDTRGYNIGTMAYCLSQGAMRDYGSHINDDMIEEFGKRIAAEMLDKMWKDSRLYYKK